MALLAGVFESVWVDSHRIVGRVDGLLVWAQTPEIVADFIYDFDLEVKPIDFELQLMLDVWCGSCKTVQSITFAQAKTGSCQHCEAPWLPQLEERSRP